MNLYLRYIKVFDNRKLKKLYKYDKEILYVDNKKRACLVIYVKQREYAIPFRSNMKHQVGKVFNSNINKYGLDFTKAIPVISQDLFTTENFLLKPMEKAYYSKDENYMEISLKFEQFLENIYYKEKEQVTNHKLLSYAQKYDKILASNRIKIFNHKQEEALCFLQILNYEVLYPYMDKIYNRLDTFLTNDFFVKKMKTAMEKANKNIMIIISEEINE